MIYLHYETFNITAKAAEAMGLDSTQMVKLKFASNKTTVKLQTADFNKVKDFYLPLIKQIPAGKRKYDPIDNIWTIPAASFDVIRQLVEHESTAGMYGPTVIKHKDLMRDYILADKQPSQERVSWQEQVREKASFSAEAPEEFFNQALPSNTKMLSIDIETNLKILMRPFVTFELNTREDFMRGYKLACRRLHPDIKGGDAQKMSELNSLWMQYKEIA